MEYRDLEAVVSVHLQCFKGFFLTYLGPRFLHLYYQCVCTDPAGISLVYTAEDRVVGFVVGSTNPRGFYTRILRRYWFKFAFLSVPALMRKPSIVRRLLGALYHPQKNPIGEDVAGLYSIGVSPQTQGSGVGQKLVKSFIDQVKNTKCSKIFLTTDRENNVETNNFYSKIGFIIKRDFRTAEGRYMNEYWLELDDESCIG